MTWGVSGSFKSFAQSNPLLMFLYLALHMQFLFFFSHSLLFVFGLIRQKVIVFLDSVFRRTALDWSLHQLLVRIDVECLRVVFVKHLVTLLLLLILSAFRTNHTVSWNFHLTYRQVEVLLSLVMGISLTLRTLVTFWTNCSSVKGVVHILMVTELRSLDFWQVRLLLKSALVLVLLNLWHESLMILLPIIHLIFNYCWLTLLFSHTNSTLPLLVASLVYFYPILIGLLLLWIISIVPRWPPKPPRWPRWTLIQCFL